MHTNITLKKVPSFIYLPITRLGRSILPQSGKKRKYININYALEIYIYFVFGATASPLTRFLNHTQRRIAVGRTPLDE